MFASSGTAATNQHRLRGTAVGPMSEIAFSHLQDAHVPKPSDGPYPHACDSDQCHCLPASRARHAKLERSLRSVTAPGQLTGSRTVPIFKPRRPEVGRFDFQAFAFPGLLLSAVSGHRLNQLERYNSRRSSPDDSNSVQGSEKPWPENSVMADLGFRGAC